MFDPQALDNFYRRREQGQEIFFYRDKTDQIELYRDAMQAIASARIGGYHKLIILTNNRKQVIDAVLGGIDFQALNQIGLELKIFPDALHLEASCHIQAQKEFNEKFTNTLIVKSFSEGATKLLFTKDLLTEDG